MAPPRVVSEVAGIVQRRGQNAGALPPVL